MVDLNGKMLVEDILVKRQLKCIQDGAHTNEHCEACGVHEPKVPMLSIGLPATLGNWLHLVGTMFGPRSAATEFVREKYDEQGADEIVIADEGQMLIMLTALHVEHVVEEGY